MNNTLFFLVTCTKESTRFEVLKQVINNLSSVMDDNFFKNLLVFDNGSTHPGSLEILKEKFENVYHSKKNIGYWSAIFWCLSNYQKLMKKEYKYIYIIESDLIHFHDATFKLNKCEEFLDLNNDVGSIRTEEFSVLNKHLYDKRKPSNTSRKYAWVVQENFIEKKRVEFILSNDELKIYKCNFLAKLPGFSRIEAIKDVFLELSKLKNFDEIDYQKFYYEKYKISAVLEGGIFHSKLTNELPKSIINGSSNFDKKIDYKPTRFDSITQTVFEDVIKI